MLVLLLGKVKPSVLLMGEIVRSGDIENRWLIPLIGDVGESELIDRDRVSAIRRRACSRNRACRSSCTNAKRVLVVTEDTSKMREL